MLTIIFLSIIIIIIILLLISKPKSKPNIKSTPKSNISEILSVIPLDIVLNKNYGKNINQILSYFPIYYINLDRSTSRYENMKNQIDFYEVKNIFRISAINGNELQDTRQGIIEITPTISLKYTNSASNFIKTELGCTLSHLKAIYTSYLNDDQFSIIMEDDVGFGLIPFWEVTLKDIIDNAPKDWQIISLWCSKKECLKIKGYLPYPKYTCWGAVCYVISRSGMESVLKCVKDNTIHLHDPLQADYLYATTYGYTIKPLFYLMSTQSTIADSPKIEASQSYRNIKYYMQDIFYKLPKLIISNNPENNQLIPKNILKILITENGEIPLVKQYILGCVQSWIEFNPDYNFVLFDEKDCVKFLKERFPEKVLESYNALKPYAYKSDLVRICWLYQYGGVYSDFRMKLLVPLKEIIKPNISFCIPNDFIIDNGCENPLVNGFMAFTPNNPILKKIIDTICYNVSIKYYGRCPLCLTGPVVVGNSARSIVGGKGPFVQGIHNWQNNIYEILQFDKNYITQNGKNIIEVKPKKNEFNSDISTGNVYWKLWNDKDVYN